jgi:hypothetical protein
VGHCILVCTGTYPRHGSTSLSSSRGLHHHHHPKDALSSSGSADNFGCSVATSLPEICQSILSLPCLSCTVYCT